MFEARLDRTLKKFTNKPIVSLAVVSEHDLFLALTSNVYNHTCSLWCNNAHTCTFKLPVDYVPLFLVYNTCHFFLIFFLSKFVFDWFSLIILVFPTCTFFIFSFLFHSIYSLFVYFAYPSLFISFSSFYVQLMVNFTVLIFRPINSILQHFLVWEVAPVLLLTGTN